jgi:hypothetical protein
MTENTFTMLMNFRIPKDLKDQFHETCRNNRTHMSTELIRLVNQYLHLDLTERVELKRLRDRLGSSATGPRRTVIDRDTGLPITED